MDVVGVPMVSAVTTQQVQYKDSEFQWEQTLSVAEAIREAMESTSSHGREYPPQRPSTLRDLPATEPHLPLRKAEPKRLHAPRPLWTNSQHQVRGFNPSPVQAVPHIDNVTASNEHAFAGRDDSRRRPFKPPLGVQVMKHGQETQPGTQYAERPGSSRVESRSPSSPFLPPPHSPQVKSLRGSRSLGEGLKGLKHRFSQPSRAPVSPNEHRYPSNPPYASNPASHRPSMATDYVRESFKSALTSNSSLHNTSSIYTEQSSMTGNSSQSDFVTVYPDWPGTEREEGEVSVDDVLGMYEDGFSSAKQSMDTTVKQSLDTNRKRSLQETRPASQPSEQEKTVKRPTVAHRRSQSASLLDRFQKFGGDGLAPPARHSVEGKRRSRISSERMSGDGHSSNHTNGRPVTQSPSAGPAPPPTNPPRDRYGFKKASNYYTLAQYEAWDRAYSVHLERRRDKWHKLMRSYGLSTDKPFRFPPKSDKIKRYVRKGIPADLRGAAWFWYGGGPQLLKEEPGLYRKLLERVEQGELSDNDREHIERDLNRTFPDNAKFKPDPTTTLDAQAGAGGGGSSDANGAPMKGKKKGRHSMDPETPILSSLRRVLQAFAIHNPETGYCQSLNFIAGLLLLFLDSDEEKAFILLNVVTSVHLPGTHGVALEGANIDIAVLMSCIKDSLPAVWAKLDDQGGVGTGPVAEALRLPTVSLATTAWFMSLFVGTLPIECVLRVWDCLFFEGSKTLFRIALAIFKHGQAQILAVNDPMEVFQLVQTIPRGLLDVNGLLDVCFKRRGGFGHVSQELIEKRRAERRALVKAGVKGLQEEVGWLRRLRGGKK